MDLICPKSLRKVAHNCFSSRSVLVLVLGTMVLLVLVLPRLFQSVSYQYAWSGVSRSNGAIQLKKLPRGLNYITSGTSHQGDRTQMLTRQLYRNNLSLDASSDFFAEEKLLTDFLTPAKLTAADERKLFKSGKWLTFECFKMRRGAILSSGPPVQD